MMYTLNPDIDFTPNLTCGTKLRTRYNCEDHLTIVSSYASLMLLYPAKCIHYKVGPVRSVYHLISTFSINKNTQFPPKILSMHS